jgi:hypothetical protein
MRNRYTTKTFVDKCEELFGDMFDYTESIFTSMREKFSYVCKIHGKQTITPENHLRVGCLCCNEKRFSTELFIRRARIVHGERYDYSEVICNESQTKVSIICEKHGKFLQKSDNHLMCKGCAACAGRKKIDSEEFFKRCLDIHGDFYDYSESVFTTPNAKIIIGCPKHSKFLQSPRDHMRNHGCPKCAIEKNTDNCRWTLEEFLEIAKGIHGERYDYSDVVYINSDTTITFSCKKHGKFQQKPTKHTHAKQGCPMCVGKNKTTEMFIEVATKVHDGIYDYSETIYLKNKTKVVVGCKKCGHIFDITPNNHLRGKGCPRCIHSNGEKAIERYLKDNSKNYDTQHRFPECVHKKPLPFDFSVFDKDDKLIGLIEYQGSQHFNPVTFGLFDMEKAIENYATLQVRDKIKKDFCESFGIPFLELSCNDDKNLVENLTKFLKSLPEISCHKYFEKSKKPRRKLFSPFLESLPVIFPEIPGTIPGTIPNIPQTSHSLQDSQELLEGSPKIPGTFSVDFVNGSSGPSQSVPEGLRESS